MNILTIAMALMAAPPDADAVARSLDEVARIATVMVDGDLCRRIVTPRAIAAILKEDPRDRWAGADNYDVDHAAYIQTKKLLARLGRLEDAISQLDEALRLRPDSAEAHNDLGTVLMMAGQREKGFAHFSAALRLQPDLAVARDNFYRAQRELEGRQK